MTWSRGISTFVVFIICILLAQSLPISHKCPSLVSKERGRRNSTSTIGRTNSQAHTSASLESPAGLVYHPSVVLKLPDSHWLGVELLWKSLTSGSHLRQCALVDCCKAWEKERDIKREEVMEALYLITNKIFFHFCSQPKLWHSFTLEWEQIYIFGIYFDSVQFSSVAQSCPTLCDPMNCSSPGLPVHHQLPEFTQTHVHRVGDAIQPSHPLSSPSLSALSLPQHQGLFQWVSPPHQVAKVLEFQLQHQSFQWTPRTDLL